MKLRFFLGSLLALLVFPAPLWALQVHPSPEGLVAHEIAHLFFAFAMVLFAYRIRRMRLSQRPHWRYLQYAAALLVVWNLWAFLGHLIALEISPEVFFPQDGGDYHFCQKKILIAGWRELLFYILKNDNLFTLPAFYLIYRGISRMEALLRGET
ncbi:MAG: hypothetical protein GXO20_04020 [Thermodesulfobacteria bacterium]|nr:hypothetical protein [Thermodesulfobacteriota bacterium]